MAKRERVTNTQLAARQDTMEGELRGVKEDVKKLSAEVAPLHAGMLQIQGGVTLLKWMVSGIGVAATVLELLRVIQH